MRYFLPILQIVCGLGFIVTGIFGVMSAREQARVEQQLQPELHDPWPPVLKTEPERGPMIRILYGEHCFAEFNPSLAKADMQPWTVQKYGMDWSFCLDRREDAEELMRRIDAYEERIAGFSRREKGAA